MGEKEPTPGKPSKEQRTESGLETAAGRSVGSGSEEQLGRDPAGGGGSGDPLETSNLNLSKSNINRTTTGDPDFDLMAVRQKAEPGPKSQ